MTKHSGFSISLGCSIEPALLRVRSPMANSGLVEIARALLIDEPAAGLNPAEVVAVLRRITTLRERGITVVMVEHNMDLVMTVADRILVMDYGQQLFEGAPADVQSHPDVIAAYLGADVL